MRLYNRVRLLAQTALNEGAVAASSHHSEGQCLNLATSGPCTLMQNSVTVLLWTRLFLNVFISRFIVRHSEGILTHEARGKV